MTQGPYRVMVVDDSVIIRSLITRILESNKTIKVVASVANGQLAIKALETHPHIEAVILDIQMPVMDGLTALPLLIEKNPALKVIMSSTVTLRNAKISMKALALGACDYIPKPTATYDILNESNFRRELIEKVIAHIDSKRCLPEPVDSPVSPTIPQGKTAPPPLPSPTESLRLPLREIPPRFHPAILAIGSSTGGPQALLQILGDIDSAVDMPIVITQHMPAAFTSILAEHIASVCHRPAAEARQGEEIRKGHIYVAPGNYHMRIRGQNGNKIITLDQGPPVNFCRPSVDTMLKSIAALKDYPCLTVMLSGMGRDGSEGSQHIIENGGCIIAQDKTTSAVWGMPGAVAQKGLCSAILPVKKISAFLNDFMAKTRR